MTAVIDLPAILREFGSDMRLRDSENMGPTRTEIAMATAIDRLRRELADMRTMLALTYAAAHPSEGILYGDDGELQFGGFPDPIDFVRDSVSEIRSKIDARGMRRLASAMAEPKEPQP